MQSHRIQQTWRSKLRNVVPFGLGQTKPKHFRDMLKIIWKNRDNLPYAYKVLTRGVCDGCALGVAGLHDWTIKGPHLCMTRLNLLRLNTMPKLDVSLLEDVSKLKHLDNAQLRELGRLPYPMVREKGAKGFRRICWNEAISRISKKIRATDPKRLAFFVTSRGVTNEVYYMAQKAARFIGTNNVDNAARLCHSPSTGAMKYAIGVAASTCSYKDWYGTDLIILFGANPANDQPVTTKYFHEAKQLGTKVVVVNPYREPGLERYWVPSTASSALFGTNIMDYWYPVTQGGDIAFLYGVIKIILENGWEDRSFVAGHTEGIADLRAAADKLDWPTLEKQAGLSKASMQSFAELIRDAKNAVIIWSMGITQHSYGGDAVSMVLNLGLLKGYVGRDKCGLMPIRGHSSVQGGAEMGAYSTVFPGVKPINAQNARALAVEYGFPIPEWQGMPTTEMVDASARGDLDILYSVGGNFLRTMPEPDYVAKAMANIPMRVHQDIMLTDQMFIEAKEEVILLPAKTRYEQDDGGIETTTERRVAFSPEIPRQVGEAKAEWKILREIAAAVYPEKSHLLKCETGDAMRDEIARVVPFYDGIQGLNKTGDAIQYGGPHLCADWKFATADGKAHFKPVLLPIQPVGFATAKACTEGDNKCASNAFMVSTRRGKQFNTLIYDEIDPLTGAARDAIFMNADDAERLQLKHDQRVALVNNVGRYEGRVFIAPIAPGNLQVHWPEGNVIIERGVYDTIGGVPDYNAMARVEKIA